HKNAFNTNFAAAKKAANKRAAFAKFHKHGFGKTGYGAHSGGWGGLGSMGYGIWSGGYPSSVGVYGLGQGIGHLGFGAGSVGSLGGVGLGFSSMY
ncbi:hypothetical protein BVRB_025810, partial [Beta vulgaris subsp. vulgaris]